MLKIEGNLGGQVFEKPTTISAIEFAKLIGGLPEFKQDDVYILKINPDSVKNVPGEGAERVPPSLTLPSYYSANLSDGSSYTLRYYKTETPSGNGLSRFTPNNVTFGKKAVSYPSSNYDLFVFMATGPWCMSSKCCTGIGRFFVYDPIAESNTLMLIAEKQSNLLNLVQAASDSRIIAKSVAMVVEGKTTQVPSTSPVQIHRNGLITLLIGNPIAFEREWNSDENLLRGLLVMANERRAIFQTVESGKPCWRWKHNNLIAVYIQPAQDPFSSLYDWASSPENYATVMNILTTVFSIEDRPTAVDAPSVEPVKQVSVVEQKVRSLINNADMYLERSTKGVYLSGGAEPLLVVTDLKNWITEVIARLEGADAGLLPELDALIDQ